MQSHQKLVIAADNAKLPPDDNLGPYLDNHIHDDPLTFLWPYGERSDVPNLSRPDYSAGIRCDFLNPMEY